MNRTVELVNEWAQFEEKYPGGTLEDFYRYQLTHQREEKNIENNVLPFQPGDIRFALVKCLNRLSKLWIYYSLNGLKPLGIGSFDEFVFLISIDRLQPMKKTEIINLHFFELSSGLLIIDRLKKKGFISEKDDISDKRSKRISLSKKGKQLLEQCIMVMHKIATQYFEGMPQEDIALCVQLLTPLEDRMASKWHQSRNDNSIAGK